MVHPQMEDVPLEELMYPVLTRIPGESYYRRLRSLLLSLRYIFWVLINSLVCWFCRSTLGLVLFQICYSQNKLPWSRTHTKFTQWQMHWFNPGTKFNHKTHSIQLYKYGGFTTDVNPARPQHHSQTISGCEPVPGLVGQCGRICFVAADIMHPESL